MPSPCHIDVVVICCHSMSCGFYCHVTIRLHVILHDSFFCCCHLLVMLPFDYISLVSFSLLLFISFSSYIASSSSFFSLLSFSIILFLSTCLSFFFFPLRNVITGQHILVWSDIKMGSIQYPKRQSVWQIVAGIRNFA